MISADQFIEPAYEHGYLFYTGVPCSFLTPLINRVISHPRLTYVGATSEGEAVAVAAGAWLAGRQAVVMCQNSGLGNAVNPLTSLNHPFRIPLLLIVTWRGQPGLHDEPQHALMGEVTTALLDVIRVEHAPFPNRPEDVYPTLSLVNQVVERAELPFALVMPKGAVRDEPLGQISRLEHPRGQIVDLRSGSGVPRRIDVLERVVSILPEGIGIVATTGKTGRELFTLADREQHLYLVGSMGCASGLSLGIALNCPRKVLVLDGDGAALMKLGSMATIGAHAPPNLIHLILDNGVHDSTGGQATVSSSVDFGGAAVACGYASAFSCDGIAGLEEALADAVRSDHGPSLIHIRIAPGSIERLGRPTVAPYDVARRFKRFLARGASDPERPHIRAHQERTHA